MAMCEELREEKRASIKKQKDAQDVCLLIRLHFKNKNAEILHYNTDI